MNEYNAYQKASAAMSDVLAAIKDQNLEGRFIDDNINLIFQLETAIDALKPIIDANNAARSLILRYGAETKLCDMPDECFSRMTELDELVSLAGEEYSPRKVVNDWNCWNSSLADFCDDLLCRVYLLHGAPL